MNPMRFMWEIVAFRVDSQTLAPVRAAGLRIGLVQLGCCCEVCASVLGMR